MDHHMRIQRPSLGDEHVSWDPADEKSVAEARKKFDAALSKGHRAFRIERQEQLTEFDPSAEELLLVAPLAGG